MPIVFRVENTKTYQGLWYNDDGHFSPIVQNLTEGKCKDLPMEFDPAFKLDGLNWISACEKTSEIRDWFSDQDRIELSQQGYKLYGYSVPLIRHINGHVVFVREQITGTIIYDGELYVDGTRVAF